MQLKTFFGVILLIACLGILLPLISEDVRLINYVNAAEENGKILLFIRHGVYDANDIMIEEEIDVMSRMLEEAGFDVIVATAPGEVLEGKTTKLTPDITLADVNMEEYAGLMLPCFSAGSTSWHALPEEIALVQQAVSLGKPIAAQHGAVIMLAEAGALAGKKYAFTKDLTHYAKDFADANATYSGEGVIQDGNIITSSFCPRYAKYGAWHGTVELTERFIKALQTSE